MASTINAARLPQSRATDSNACGRSRYKINTWRLPLICLSLHHLHYDNIFRMIIFTKRAMRSPSIVHNNDERTPSLQTIAVGWIRETMPVDALNNENKLTPLLTLAWISFSNTHAKTVTSALPSSACSGVLSMTRTTTTLFRPSALTVHV